MKTNRTINRFFLASGVSSAWSERKFPVVMLLAVAMLSGCVKNTVEKPGADRDAIPVKVSFAVPGFTSEENEFRAFAPATRATLAEKATVRVVVYNHFSEYMTDQAYCVTDGRLVPCTVNNDGSFKMVSPGEDIVLPFLPSGLEMKYNFYAITPALPLNVDKTVTVANGVDYATSKTEEVLITSTGKVTLSQLVRKCARVQLVVQKSADYTALSALNIAAGGVTISNLPTSQKVVPGSDFAEPAAMEPGSLTVPESAFSLVGTTLTATVALLPNRSEKTFLFDYNLSLSFGGEAVVSMIPTSILSSLLPGRSYTLTLTLKPEPGNFFLSISPWESGGDQSIGMGDLSEADPFPKVEYGTTIVSKDMYGSASGPFHENWPNGSPAHYETSPDNSISAKFEVASTGEYYPWAQAGEMCPSGWRLPTLAELILIQQQQSRLTGITPFREGSFYWSSTQERANTDNAWCVHLAFSPGMSIDPYSMPKSDAWAARCVRDVD